MMRSDLVRDLSTLLSRAASLFVAACVEVNFIIRLCERCTLSAGSSGHAARRWRRSTGRS